VLDLVLTTKEGLVGNVKLKGSVGCSNHEIVKFEVLRRSCKEGAQQAHYLGLQESRLWPFQGSAQYSTMT